MDFAPVAQLDRVADFESEIVPYTISKKQRFCTREQRFCQINRRPTEGQENMFGAHFGARQVTLLVRPVYIGMRINNTPHTVTNKGIMISTEANE
jgi:hypothetical protein